MASLWQSSQIMGASFRLTLSHSLRKSGTSTTRRRARITAGQRWSWKGSADCEEHPTSEGSLQGHSCVQHNTDSRVGSQPSRASFRKETEDNTAGSSTEVCSQDCFQRCPSTEGQGLQRPPEEELRQPLWCSAIASSSPRPPRSHQIAGGEEVGETRRSCERMCSKKLHYQNSFWRAEAQPQTSSSCQIDQSTADSNSSAISSACTTYPPARATYRPGSTNTWEVRVSNAISHTTNTCNHLTR